MGLLALRPFGSRPDGRPTPFVIELGGGIEQATFEFENPQIDADLWDVTGPVGFAGIAFDIPVGARRTAIRLLLRGVVSNAFDKTQLHELLEERALAHDSMDASRVFRVREEMERAEARRLQPHYIESFLLEAFKRMGGTVRQREPRGYEVTHVPAPVRNRDRQIGTGDPVLARYVITAYLGEEIVE